MSLERPAPPENFLGDPPHGWTQSQATRPKVERKLAHLMRRRHGGRRARMRGRERVAQDFTMLCAAVNLQRLARVGLRWADAPVVA
jgi:hypothetical protein